MTSTDTVSGNGALADLGFQAIEFFRKVKTTLEDKADDAWDAHMFLAEAERFELWAANLGLFVPGHGSLDYRVREAERLGQTLYRFLQDLVNSLDDVVCICSSTIQDQTPDDEQKERNNSDLEGSGAEDNESDIDLLLDGIRDPINRLFKISTKIRSPSTRFGSLRAANYQQLDSDTGVDFLQAIRENDRDYVRSIFLQYQKDRACEEHESRPPDKSTGEDGDEVWEPIRTVLSHQRSTTDSFLVDRIAEANLRRRQQFAYWAKHRDKVYRHFYIYTDPKTELKTELPPAQLPKFAPAASVTTATTVNIAQLEAIDNRSTWTISEYAPSTWQPAREMVDFPSPPKLPRNTRSDEPFECPFCFILCPHEMLADKAWKAHLIHDLRPYICTYEKCRNPTQLYDTRQDWVQHENSAHRRIWRCLEHSDKVFQELEAYQHHLRREHAESNSDELSMGRVIQASESVSDVADRACPICMATPNNARAMEGHLALHLEKLARFSFPRSVNDVSEGESDADSDKAYGIVEEDSRDGGFGNGSDEGLNEIDDVSLEDGAGLPIEMATNKETIELSLKPLDISSSITNPAEVLRSQGKDDDAQQIHQEALELREKVDSLNNVANMLESQGKDQEAEKTYRQIREEIPASVTGDSGRLKGSESMQRDMKHVWYCKNCGFGPLYWDYETDCCNCFRVRTSSVERLIRRGL